MQWQITPQTSFFDEEVSIRLIDLPRNKKIKIKASMEDLHGQTWMSEALFLTDEKGYLDVSQACSFKGSYQGVDPRGLFWSMRLHQKAAIRTLFIPQGLLPHTVTLQAFLGKKLVGETTLSKIFLNESVMRCEVNEENTVGVLFVPNTQNTENAHPAIVLIPGSSGVRSCEGMAALLAAKGYVVMVLGYYAYPGLPQELYDLPLERFQAGIRWVKAHPAVDKNRVAVMGISKGAEALLATLAYLPDPQVKAIIAQMPSHVIWQGVGRGRPVSKSSWTLFNEPLHFLPFAASYLWLEVFKRQCCKKYAMRCLKGYQSALHNKRQVEEALIPLENLRAPLLLISGRDDLLWPSSQMSVAIKQHLMAKNFAYAVDHLDLEGVGHTVRYPGLPTTVSQASFSKLTLAFGGKPVYLAKASEVYWQALHQFLNTYV